MHVSLRSLWLAAVLLQALGVAYLLTGWQGWERPLAVVWLLALAVQAVAAWRLKPSA